MTQKNEFLLLGKKRLQDVTPCSYCNRFNKGQAIKRAVNNLGCGIQGVYEYIDME